MDQSVILEDQLQKDHSRILAFVQKTDLDLLHQYLPEEYTVINGNTSSELESVAFDICIIDYDSFQLYRDFLVNRKRKEAPVLLPILLLTTDDRPLQQNGVIWNLVDDIMKVPVPPKILSARIQNLLRSRHYSVDLKKKNDQLSLFEKALDATNNGVILTDARQADNPIIYCNKEFEELTGFSEEEILGQNCRFLQSDDRDQQAVNQLRSFIENGTEGKVILRNYRKDGSMFWNEVKIAPINNEKGEITHFIGIQNDVSKLVNTQQKLHEEKERYRLITENSTDMISLHDPDGTYLYVSPSCKKLVGYSANELIGTNAFETMHPDDRARIKAKHKAFLKSGKELRISFRKQTKSSTYKWVETVMRAIRDSESGKITEIQAATRDISERKKYEQKLRSEKEFSDTIINGMPVIFYMINDKMELTYWNKMLENTLGYSTEELNGMHPLEIYQVKDHDFVRSKIQEALETGSTEMEVEVLTKQGTVQHHYITGKKFESNQGTFIIGTGIDMTERVKAEKELQESEQRWEQLVNKNPSLVQLTDANFNIIFVNPAGAQLYGKDAPGELMGKPVDQFISFEKFDVLKSRMKKILNGESLQAKIFQVETWDGRKRSIELQSVSVDYHDKRVLLTVGKDVTEQANYEEKLKQSLREKEVLLQEIHHRVKNNLAVVSGLLQIQRYNSNKPEIQKILSDSEMRIKTMALIHEKLYQSRSLSKINMDSYLRDLVSSIKETINPQKNIQIDFDCDIIELNINQAVPCALIINELVANAIEHAFPNSNGGTVQIRIKNDNNLISISIRDDGIGFADGQIDKKSMGFTIVETLCYQLEAELDIKNDNGTVVSLSFEKKEVKGSGSAFLQ